VDLSLSVVDTLDDGLVDDDTVETAPGTRLLHLSSVRVICPDYQCRSKGVFAVKEIFQNRRAERRHNASDNASDNAII